MIQISSTATIRTGSPRAFADARAEFEARGFLKLPGFFAPAFLRATLDAIDRATFVDRVHDGIGVEQCLAPGVLPGALELACNDRVLFDLVDELTGCGSIGCFEGRVYRMAGGEGHYDSWHSDVGEDRLIAMSVNLGRAAFQGGVLQIRRARSDAPPFQVENHTAGDAVIFRIDPAYRHRVGPIAPGGARTAYAGWFRARPDFAALLAAAVEQRIS
jgi:hypothetical protein